MTPSPQEPTARAERAVGNAVDALVRVVADLNNEDPTIASVSDNEWAIDVVIRMRDLGWEIVPDALVPAAATEPLDADTLTEALHHLHSVELWQWWEPQPDGGALVRKGTSPDFAAAILRALSGVEQERHYHEHRWVGPDQAMPHEYCTLCGVARLAAQAAEDTP